MKKYTQQEIVQRVPEVETAVLPDDWFDALNNDKESVFKSLYWWMLRTKSISSDDWQLLPNRTYVGEKLYKKLLAAEKNAFKEYSKMKRILKTKILTRLFLC